MCTCMTTCVRGGGGGSMCLSRRLWLLRDTMKSYAPQKQAASARHLRERQEERDKKGHARAWCVCSSWMKAVPVKTRGRR